MAKLPSDEAKWPPKQLDVWCADVDREPAPTWLVPGFLPTDGAVMLSGKAKISHKTWLAFTLAKCVASGEAAGLFEPTRQGAVLFIEEEGPRKSTRARWKFLQHGLGIATAGLPIYFVHRQNVLLDDPVWLGRICDFVRDHGVLLVVLDTISRVNRGDENSVQDVSKIASYINKIRQSNPGNCTVLMLHHLRKTEYQDSDTDIDDDLRGSSAWSGYYDSHLALRKRQINQSYIRLTARHKDWAEEEYHISWAIKEKDEYADFTLVKADPATISAELRQVCMDKLAPGESYSPRDLQRIWAIGRNETAQIIDGALKTRELVKNGKVYICSNDSH